MPAIPYPWRFYHLTNHTSPFTTASLQTPQHTRRSLNESNSWTAKTIFPTGAGAVNPLDMDISSFGIPILLISFFLLAFFFLWLVSRGKDETKKESRKAWVWHSLSENVSKTSRDLDAEYLKKKESVEQQYEKNLLALSYRYAGAEMDADVETRRAEEKKLVDVFRSAMEKLDKKYMERKRDVESFERAIERANEGRRGRKE